MKTDVKTFIKKYLTHYYIFGYCCILGFGLQTVFYLLNYHFVPRPFTYVVQVMLTIGSILLVRKWILITYLSKRKYRYYKLGIEMLERNEYKEHFFLNGMYDPCFRVITKDVLYNYKRKYEYSLLKEKKKLSKYPFQDDNFDKIYD